jgi:precorrin-6B C5,15-methyltransferase / cobalt-precorrin-6B C5,C15-methyltransferase
VLAHLRPGPGLTLWDVGAGCGSVAIEWLRAGAVAGAAAHAVAVEPDPARIAMMRSNASALGVPHLAIVAGRAPDALAGLAAPDAVFIGGGLSMPGVFEATFDALKPQGRLVATAVTLESEARLLELHAHHGGSLTRIAVSRAVPVGRFEGWKPFMPVTIWALEKP